MLAIADDGGAERRNLSGFQSISPRVRFFGTSNPHKTKGKKSLNYEKRLRDHKQIISENEAFLKRLQDKQSSFNVIRWHKEEQQRKKLLNNIKDYKRDFVRKHH